MLKVALNTMTITTKITHKLHHTVNAFLSDPIVTMLVVIDTDWNLWLQLVSNSIAANTVAESDWTHSSLSL
jgi:hypothetical protein